MGGSYPLSLVALDRIVENRFRQLIGIPSTPLRWRVGLYGVGEGVGLGVISLLLDADTVRPVDDLTCLCGDDADVVVVVPCS